jgi:hypothetical protein
MKEGAMSEKSMQAVLESIDSKLDLVFEGFTALDRKIDQVRDDLEVKIDQCNFKIDVLNEKIDTVESNLSRHLDAVAADLSAHRADTECHRGGYLVSE